MDARIRSCGRALRALVLGSAGVVLGAAPATLLAQSCDPSLLREPSRLPIEGAAGETDDFPGWGRFSKELEPESLRAIELLGPGSVWLLALSADDSPLVDYRVLSCRDGRWAVLPLLLGGRKKTLFATEDNLAPLGGHLALFHGGAPRGFLSWDGAVLRQVHWPLRLLSRVDGLYVSWSCKQDAGLAPGLSVLVVRAGRNLAKGAVTGAFDGACEAELDQRTYDGSALPGDLVQVLR